MIGGLAAVLFLWAIPAIGAWLLKLAWRDGESTYDRLGVAAIPFGDNAR